MPRLKNSRILVGLTGSVAISKAPDLIRRLRQEGADVTVVMTDASKRFITPLSLEVASEGKVYSDLFSDPMAHIALPKSADLMLIAPATANTMGKLANGIADDLLSACFLAFTGKVIIAPAMNWRMYESPSLQRNLTRLIKDNVLLIPPEKGMLACGEEGIGRMADIEKIITAVRSSLSPKDLIAEKLLVTAGPTREYIDEVRFISNRSTGKMGYAVADAARTRGAHVTLISGPSALEPIYGVDFIPIETAGEMREAVLKHVRDATVVVMAAAVTDFSPATRHKGKMEKATVKSLSLKGTPDILAELGAMRERPLLIGFAAEFGYKPERAKKKLIAKGADLIVFNDVSDPHSGFGTDTNRAVLIGRDIEEELPLMTKLELADALLDRLIKLRKR